MKNTTSSSVHIPLLATCFFFSGVAGLIYQVAWQRILFSAFGIDLISVAIIVSAFMLGMGVGALLGGVAVDIWPEKAIMLFALSEAGIGLFGFCSPHLMSFTAELCANSSLTIVAISNFILVLFPTILMGATLPILISHLVRIWQVVGKATGHLYAINTFGAAYGAIVTTYFLFEHLTLNSVIYLAGCINLMVAVIVLRFSRR